MYFVIKNIMDKLKDSDPVSPTPPITVSITPAPTNAPEITPEVTPQATPTPTQAPVTEVKLHKVKAGETLSSIAKQYYGDDWIYVEKLGMYNKIPAPYNNISIGQELKIPSKEELKGQ
jgi:nucleoid-associated protein YgaU